MGQLDVPAGARAEGSAFWDRGAVRACGGGPAVRKVLGNFWKKSKAYLRAQEKKQLIGI